MREVVGYFWGKKEPTPEGVTEEFAREAAMMCEECHALMIERLPARENEDSNKEEAVVLECPQCGHTEYQPLITSFWRRLAA